MVEPDPDYHECATCGIGPCDCAETIACASCWACSVERAAGEDDSSAPGD